jgi:TRAP-type C4-dicarboxylate transport system substrate-binding protein
MKKFKTCVFLILLSFVLVFSTVGCSSNAPTSPGGTGAAQVSTNDEDWEGIDLKLASNAMDEGFLTEFAEKITEVTDGKVTITIYSRDSFGTGPDVLAMVENGSLDITQLGASDTDTGTFPITAITEIPFLYSSPTEATELVYALYHAGYMDQELSNVHLLFMWATDGQRIAFAKKKPETVADFKGLKLRILAASLTSMMESLDASGTKIATSDVYMSLERGVIDGAVSTPTAMIKNKYEEVCDYIMTDYLYNGISFVLMAPSIWDKIPAEYQKRIDNVCEDYRYEYLTRNYVNEKAALKELSDKGVEMFSASNDIKTAIQSLKETALADYGDNISKLGYDADAILDLTKTTIDRVSYQD